jgi:hypothetical protein
MTTEQNRRRVLIGLVAASGAAAGVQAGEAPQVQEAHALLELGNPLPDIETPYWVARKRAEAIVKEVAKVWPDAPKEIRFWIAGTERETTITGGAFPVLGSPMAKSHAS